jgi:hypothetical protein
METTKKFLRISTGVSFIILSAALLIFSIKTNTASAQTAPGYVPVGIEPTGASSGIVVGYNAKIGDARVIARYHP